MAKGAGQFGNLPPSMGQKAPRANPEIMTSGGRTQPSQPIGPGRPRNSPAPDKTMNPASPVGPGAPRNKSQPDYVPGFSKNPGRATGVTRGEVKEGKPKEKRGPMLPGMPGREGGVKAGSTNGAYGGRGGKRGGGKMSKGGKMAKSANNSGVAAGVPQAYGP